MVTTLLMPASRSKVGSDCELWPLLEAGNERGSEDAGVCGDGELVAQRREKKGRWLVEKVCPGGSTGRRKKKEKGREREKKRRRERRRRRGG